jgi:histidinol-phosphatase
MLPQSNPEAYNLSKVLQESRKVRFYGDGIQHTLVCRGYAHAAIDTVMNPWDVAALVPCIREAGGIITSLDGEETDIIHRPTILSSCSPQLHQELLMALKPESKKLALAG